MQELETRSLSPIRGIFTLVRMLINVSKVNWCSISCVLKLATVIS